MPRFNSTGISRKLTIAAVGGVLCAATVAAPLVAGSLLGTGPTASVVRAADMLALDSGSHSARGSAGAAVGVGGKQALIIAAAHRAAAARTEAVEAAARLAAARAAALRAAKQAASEQAAAQRAAERQAASEQPAAGTPQQIAQQLLGQYGWAGQFSCLDDLWEQESGWNIYAENPTTGAYGIPQALPGAKMSSAGPDWQSDATTQIRWGLDYIQGSYGSPCAAWDHEEAAGWY